MRPYFIVNPIAGGGAVLQKFETAKAYLGIKDDEACVYTEREQQSRELAAAAYENGERFIVAVGGDGTVNEVASALCGKQDAVMGIFPFGTGNDMAKALKLPTEPEQAAEVIASGEPRLIDMGLANDTPFINVGGLGFDVDVLINTEKYKTRFNKGMMPYFLGVLKALLHIKKVPATIRYDGKEQQKNILLCAAGNGTHYGGGMAVTPNARFDDGLFDVCIIKSACLPRLLPILPKFIKGKHLKSKLVEYFRTDEIEIETDRIPLQLDGEVGVEYAPVRFKILHKALNLMLPKEP